MKLLANLVTINQDATIITVAVAKNAVITDEEKSLAEVIQTDTVEIEGILLSKDQGAFQVQIALGGFDSSGNFHRDLRFKNGLVSWSRDQFPDKWTKYGLQDLTSLDFDTIKQWLHDENSVSIAGINIWNLPALQSATADDSGNILSDYKAKASPAPAPMPVSPPVLTKQ